MLSSSNQSRLHGTASFIDRHPASSLDRPSQQYPASVMQVQVDEHFVPRPSIEDSIFLSAERISHDQSVVSLDAGPRLRKTSFTFETVDQEENDHRIAMLMEIQNQTQKTRTTGSESRDLAIEATRRLANVNNAQEGLPTPPSLSRRKLSRPSTGSSTISRITTKSNNLVQDVTRPLGRLSRKKSSEPSPGRTETDTSGSMTTDPTESSLYQPSPPGRFGDLPTTVPDERQSKSFLSGLEIATGEKPTYATPPVEYVAYPQDSPPDHFHHAYSRSMGSPTPSRVLPQTLRFGDHTKLNEDTSPMRMRNKEEMNLTVSSRIRRRDSAVKEAKMESMVHTMMMGEGSRALRDEARQRQRSEETAHPSMRRLRTTSETGAARSRSETAGSRGTSSVMSLQDENRGSGERIKTRRSRALSDIAATPPITPVKMKPERPFELPEMNHRPSPLYTFPQQSQKQREDDAELEPVKVIKPKRSGFMSFLREKMLSRNVPDEMLGADGLSESQRIRAAYLMTTEKENIRGEERGNTLPNVKVRPSRTFSQVITPTKERQHTARSASMRIRPTTIMDPTPPRAIRPGPARDIGQSSISFDTPTDRSAPISMITLQSRNPMVDKADRSQAEEEDDKARIQRLEEELSATRKAWHSQITQLESQLVWVKDAMSLAQQEVQASRATQREKQSGSAAAGGRFCQRCSGAMGDGDDESLREVRGLVVKNP